MNKIFEALGYVLAGSFVIWVIVLIWWSTKQMLGW